MQCKMSQFRLARLQASGKTIYFIFFAINLIIHHTQAQYIVHINSKAFRGNLTFGENTDEFGEQNLVIESIIEEKHEARLNKDERKLLFGDQRELLKPILLDWTLHKNALIPSQLTSCTNDELGPQVSDQLKQSLTENRPIVLGKYSQWTIPLRSLLEANKATSLGELIWDRSIKIKLSNIYFPPAPPEPPPSASSASSSPSLLPARSSLPKLNVTALNATGSPANITELFKRPKGPSVFNKPTLPGPIRQPSTPRPVKASFGPRPRPLISGAKLKNTSAIIASSSFTIRPKPMPKAESLLLETTTSTTTSTTPTTSSTSTTASPTRAQKAPPDENPQAPINKILLKIYGRVVVCGNVIDTRNVKSAEAVFESQISGRISLRGNEDGLTKISTHLYHIKSKVTTRYDWKILSSDVLDERRHDDQCKYLQVLFDPDNADATNCTKGQTKSCKMGDLTRKHDQIQVAGTGKPSGTLTLLDLNLPISSIEAGSRDLFVALYDLSNKYSILSCAKITSLPNHRKLEANFNMEGVRGTITFQQRYPTEPVGITYDLFGLEGNVKYLSIMSLPVPVRTTTSNQQHNNRLCNQLGEIYDPSNSMLGNLTLRHGPLSVIESEYEDHYSDEFLDLNIQLYDIDTIAGRSILISKNNGDPWVCSTIEWTDEEPILVAVANFYYPIVGQIKFQQIKSNPNAETSVLVDLYNPNSENSNIIQQHNWLIHLKPSLGDFYNWSSRCESAGEVYDPIQAFTTSGDQYAKLCNKYNLINEPLRCRSGDLTLKANYKLKLPISSSNKTRFFYTDPYLPLSKLNSIIARSIVIYDEHAPKQRGNRLACSTIKLAHPLKASVKQWNSGPSIPSAVVGKISFDQEKPEAATKIKINLSGFNGNVDNYAIHEAWTMEDKEFPCSNDSLYDIYDPFTENSGDSQIFPPSAQYGSSSSATVDKIKVGDLSRKHGTFEGLQSVERDHLDSNAPLFAPNSIIGRSIVLRATVNNFRWVCGNIELDYNPSSSRLIIAMASFDEPRSKIAGYVKFYQLEHNDGSLSDTYVHVDLRWMQSYHNDDENNGRYRTQHELQTTDAHNWSIFVNQVGEDAYIVADEVRCIAAGFKWNPYLAKDTLDTYPNTCNPQEQQACAMGDLGMKHGQLSIGPNNRRIFSDSNLPLTGNYSIMSRSLIIFDNKRPSVKLACANLYPDIHLKSNVVIRRTPSFTVARFVEQMRELLNAADWLIVPELKATKQVANGECIQMTIHFYGQRAHQLQIELNNLISFGTVKKSTRVGIDKLSTHYKLCRAGQHSSEDLKRLGLLTSNANSYIRRVCLHITLLISLSSFILNFGRCGHRMTK